MKNGSRSKFLLCFRPVVDMEMVVESKGVVVDRPTRRSRTKPIENTKVEKTKVVEVKEEEEVKVQAPLTKTMSLDRECSMISSQSSKMPRSRHNRTFSRVIKAVVFETILAKKVRDGRVVRQDSFGSKRSYSMNRRKSLSLETNELMITPAETNSHEVKVNSSSNPDSAKHSTKNQEDSVTKPKKNEKGSCELNSGMYLLLISLGITVFWGRVFAILFTSLWLYFFTWSCPTSYRRRPENVRKWSEAESRDQKRRVIMEGLIERNHHFHSSQREH
ncbi:hypothetical protein RchiOBHm_Chr2g0161211 [Rosa chinensis]|uniref:Transmembrane protein n=1 Tax=Rosa chinensis TaxID=74649 RepID=A0A2P6S2P4_ROSCH|nr:uncharacterized protein LOC112189135 [Rosa chinensis]PRQ52957.1 hypothetical protein RchiOBHm_Chr2g0161211 [Rosa chinensis]